MSKRITITLPDKRYAELLQLAELYGDAPATIATLLLARIMHDRLCDGESESMEQTNYLMAVPPMGAA